MGPDQAIDLCDVILDQLLDELPDEASDFRASVEERVTDMRQWVVERGHVTERQAEALQNMRAGCERWLEPGS